MRGLAISGPAASMLSGIVCLCVACSGQPVPRHLLLCSLDTVNRSALQVYNPEAQPLDNLDLLSRRAAVFAHATTPSPWTLPAHGSLMTGLYPDRHGAVHYRTRVVDGVATLAARLAEAGFATVGFTDGALVSRAYGLAHGFQRYDDFVDSTTGREWCAVPRGGLPEEVLGQTLFDRGIAQIESWPADGPGLFLFLHTYVVHDYFLLHPWALQALPPSPRDDSDRYVRCVTGKEVCSEEDWSRLRALYDAELRRADAGIGSVLEALERRGMLDSTLVIVLSDHGEGFAPKLGRIHHGGRLHEDQIRIPLLVSGPGIPPGAFRTPASLVDVMPTVLELFGLERERDLDGVSLAGALQGREVPADRWLLAMEHCFLWQGGRRRSLRQPTARPLSMAVLYDRWWYLADARGEAVYDMAEDPDQLADAASVPEDYQPFRARVAERSRYTRVGPDVTSGGTEEERLRALGYVE